MPFGVNGKLVEPPHCQPIPIVTVWDAVALLWTIYIMGMEFIKEMELQDQKQILSMMLITLAEMITMMELNVLGRPTTVNVTGSVEKGKIKFMYGMSVCIGIQTQTVTREMLYVNNQLIAMSRVRNILILQWCHSNVV